VAIGESSNPGNDTPARAKSRGAARGRTAAVGAKRAAARDAGGTPPGDEMTRLLEAMLALEAGDFSVRLALDGDATMSRIADTFNAIATLNDRLATEVVRVSSTVEREGQMAERASLGGVTGGWAVTIDSMNSMINDLLQPTTEVARVLTAVARGDLSQKMVLEIDGKSVQGEFLRIGTTVNTMVDQLSGFASEVTRVAREVGTDGKLGGQAAVAAPGRT
jgi:methyl-accepting chemotaxis protein